MLPPTRRDAYDRVAHVSSVFSTLFIVCFYYMHSTSVQLLLSVIFNKVKSKGCHAICMFSIVDIRNQMRPCDVFIAQITDQCWFVATAPHWPILRDMASDWSDLWWVQGDVCDANAMEISLSGAFILMSPSSGLVSACLCQISQDLVEVLKVLYETQMNTMWCKDI